MSGSLKGVISTAFVLAMAHATFISTTTAAADWNHCPSIVTVDTIDIVKYVGTWYEIGSTARFKLQRENGMICDKSNYTVLNTTTAGANGQTYGATIGVTNSGRTVATIRVTRAVSDVARLSRSICSSTSSIKYQLHRIGQAVGYIEPISANQINATAPTQAKELKNATSIIFEAHTVISHQVMKISNAVNNIQMNNGRYSQLESPLPKIQSSVAKLAASILVILGTLSKQFTVINSASTKIDTSSGVLLNLNDSSGQGGRRIFAANAPIQNATGEISVLTVSIQESAGQIEATMQGLQPLLDGHLPGDGFASSITGMALQDRHQGGKLTISFPGFGTASRTPNYNIIGLEGAASSGYGAALVYSCMEGQGGDYKGAQEDVFVLSRKPNLDGHVVDNFNKILMKNGISMGCDNPFILTDQNVTKCGYIV